MLIFLCCRVKDQQPTFPTLDTVVSPCVVTHSNKKGKAALVWSVFLLVFYVFLVVSSFPPQDWSTCNFSWKCQINLYRETQRNQHGVKNDFWFSKELCLRSYKLFLKTWQKVRWWLQIKTKLLQANVVAYVRWWFDLKKEKKRNLMWCASR